MSTLPRRWYPLGTGQAAPRGRAAISAKDASSRASIDPLTGPKLALAGRVVTMDDAFTVRTDAVVYIDQGAIVAVLDRAQAAPAGFEAVARVSTGEPSSQG